MATFRWLVMRLIYVTLGVTLGMVLAAIAMVDSFTSLQDFRRDTINLIEDCTEEFGEGCSLVALPNSIILQDTVL